jgi:hypothetical protein
VLALLLLLQQGPAPTLTAAVDRPRLNVGEEVVLTIVAGGRTADAVQFDLPPFSGFALISRSETSEVTLGVERARITTLELRLRAVRAGSYAFGPIRMQQGTAQASIDGPDVEVTENAAAGMVALNPRVRDLVARAPPPKAGSGASVQVVLSRDTVLVGEQVDVLTAAWFSRELRGRLRRQPRFEPPVLAGVWAFPQTALPGIAASKRVGDKWYDLFVLHQVVFPLAPGGVTIPPVTLTYEIPVAMQFFSQDERYTVSSPARTLTVLPLPAAGQPPGFAGATGVNLKLERQITPTAARANEAVNVEIAVRGEGNVALWPSPELTWPAGTRAYAEGSTEEMQPVAGRLAGVKRFKFVVVPTQAGVLSVPAVSYPYYDFARHGYAVPTLPAMGVAVGAGKEATAARSMPPPLLVTNGPPVADLVSEGITPWGWGAILLLPPLVVMGLSLARKRRPKVVPTRRKSDDPALALDRALMKLLPREDIATSARLVPALRAAGFDVETAQAIASLRDAVQGHRYGPPGRSTAPDGESVERALGWIREVLSSRPAGIAMALLLCLASQARAQVAPDSLYAAGALSRAEEGFRKAIARSSGDPALWYGLGASRYRQGEDGAAAAAWLTALRLAPRDETIRRALLLTPPPDQVSAARRSVPPFTAAESLLLAGLCWIAGWALFLVQQRRIRRFAPVLLVLGVVLGAIAGATWWWDRRPIALAISDTPLRTSPHGRATMIRTLPSGSAVFVEREQQGWVLVRAAGKELGWLPRSAIAPAGE